MRGGVGALAPLCSLVRRLFVVQVMDREDSSNGKSGLLLVWSAVRLLFSYLESRSVLLFLLLQACSGERRMFARVE